MLAALALAWPAFEGEADAQARYALAGGCYDLTSAQTGAVAPGAGMQRLQATDLGSYLLYGPVRDFLAATGGNSVGRALAPSPAADWRVEDAPGGSFTLSPIALPNQVLSLSGGALTLVPAGGAGTSSHFTFAPAGGCAAYPEAELNASGTPARGAAPYAEVSGLIDGHMHWMTFEYIGGNFHCGGPWHRYGIPSALPDCASVEGPLGVLSPLQNFLNFGLPVFPHSTAGWPTLNEWANDNLTYEGTYHRWVERAYMAGLKLIVMPVNENRVLCQLMVNRRTNCNEMDTVFRAIDGIEEMQDYVDAQAGGPGKGFFRIVRDPLEARRVINEGKMAVVLEVEISEPFGCSGGYGLAPATCDQADVDDGLDALYDRGVRSMLLLNKWDNPLTGVRFDSGPLGAIIQAGNLNSGGSFWSAETCKALEADNSIDGGIPAGFLADTLNQLGVPPGTLPVYPPAPHCNTRGLTDLGAYTVEKMMSKGMIVNPDHMSQKAVDTTISLAEQRRYSGVISPHGWMDPRNWPRIWNLGGMAFPSAGESQNFVSAWQRLRPANTPFYFGWGYGADLGGLAAQPAPEPAGSGNAVSYPFTSLDGRVTFDRQRTGARSFDYPSEGVAHYGLYADWFEELRKVGGPQLTADMLNGPEAYLQMWERSTGLSPPPAAPGPSGAPQSSCLRKRGKLSRRGLGKLRLRLDSESLLQRAGQPLQRTRAWTYCVKGKKNARAAATAVLTPEGSVALVASSARTHAARGVTPGSPASKLKGRAKPAGRNLWLARKGKSTFAFATKRGRVRTIAVGTGAAGSRAGIKEYLALVPPRPSLEGRVAAPDQRGIPVNATNAVPLKLRPEARDFTFICGLALQPTYGNPAMTPPQPAPPLRSR